MIQSSKIKAFLNPNALEYNILDEDMCRDARLMPYMGIFDILI